MEKREKKEWSEALGKREEKTRKSKKEDMTDKKKGMRKGG